MVRDEDTEALWEEIYPELSAGGPGLLGAITARAAPQVMRLACTYAALDRTYVISRSHLDAATDAYIDRFTLPEKITCCSALKFGLLAEGSADLYPRLGPMSEWDIAAGHAVLAAAGGEMRKLDGGALRYGQANFLVSGFIATGDGRPVV